VSTVSGIYKITLNTTGQIYIGSAADVLLRWRWHRNSTRQLIGKMICRHGAENFTFEIIEEVEPTKEKLEEKEQYYLDKLQPFPWNDHKGFNLSPTAYSCLGIKRSAETKQKMRDSWHRNRGPEYYNALRERALGDKNPAKRPDVAAKISKARKGQTWKHDAVRLEKHIAVRSGKKRSPEAVENMKRAQQKNKTRSDLAKEKFYLAQRTLYEITSPDRTIFQMYSRELKLYCKENSLTYANLITTAKTNKPYKGGWMARLV
jgi:group I intron endonuclease